MEDNKDVQNTDIGEKETPQKTYTQKDIDDSFNAGVKKANSEWQKDGKYKEFLEWKKSNQNDTEKITELTTLNSTLDTENKILKAQIKVNESDVKKEFSKFVTSEVMNLVNDSIDFETALKNYKKDNPQFFGETVVRKVQTSPALTGGNQPQTTNSIMNDLLRNSRN